MHTASQEFLIKLVIGDGDFSFVTVTIAFRLNLGLNRLFSYAFYLCVCNPRRYGCLTLRNLSGYGPRTMLSMLSTG